MSDDVYEIVAQAMRYWFVALGILIVLRSFLWLRRDRKAKHRRLRSLPDAGMVGEWLVESGNRELPEGVVLPVPREGVLGDTRSCDLYVPVWGVAHTHLYLRYSPKQGLILTPAYRQHCLVNDVPVTWRSVRKQPVALHHGDILTVGEAVLRLRMFAGLKSESRPRFAHEAEPQATPIAYGISGDTQMDTQAPTIERPGEKTGIGYGMSGVTVEPVRHRRSDSRKGGG
ncbi:MAG: hypothetical protein IK127_07465 [Clostridia bacterium]|nr:hypothetical protein [Clostridia bacterium]